MDLLIQMIFHRRGESTVSVEPEPLCGLWRQLLQDETQKKRRNQIKFSGGKPKELMRFYGINDRMNCIRFTDEQARTAKGFPYKVKAYSEDIIGGLPQRVIRPVSKEIRKPPCHLLIGLEVVAT